MPSKKATKVDVVVTIADSHRSTISEVAARLKKAGLARATTLDSAGIITGSVATDGLAGLQGIAGVQAVETSRDVQIAPPDSEIQ